VSLLLNTVHRRSDFGALSPLLLPTFLNLPALPTQSLKRLFNSVAAEHGFLLKRPNTFLFFDYPNAIGTAVNGINNQDLLLRVQEPHRFRRSNQRWNLLQQPVIRFPQRY
jgi:hypothetical protein